MRLDYNSDMHEQIALDALFFSWDLTQKVFMSADQHHHNLRVQSGRRDCLPFLSLSLFLNLHEHLLLNRTCLLNLLSNTLQHLPKPTSCNTSLITKRIWTRRHTRVTAITGSVSGRRCDYWSSFTCGSTHKQCNALENTATTDANITP